MKGINYNLNASTCLIGSGQWSGLVSVPSCQWSGLWSALLSGLGSVPSCHWSGQRSGFGSVPSDRRSGQQSGLGLIRSADGLDKVQSAQFLQSAQWWPNSVFF